MVWFQVHEKMDVTPNMTLTLVVTTSINNHSVSRIIIDDGSSCDLMYLRVLMRLGLRMNNFKSCESRNLLAFNDSLTHPCGTIDLTTSSREGKNKRIVKLSFLIIPCESVYNEILERWFMAELYAVASIDHLKMKYHNRSGKDVITVDDLCGDHVIHGMVFKKPRSTAINLRGGKRMFVKQLPCSTLTCEKTISLRMIKVVHQQESRLRP